jgi:hypothetical protein
MKATTAELSTPPERKAPSGTSAIIRERTAVRRCSLSSPRSFLGERAVGLEKSTSHQRCGCGTGRPRWMSRKWPAGSFLTPATIEASSGT